MLRGHQAGRGLSKRFCGLQQETESRRSMRWFPGKLKSMHLIDHIRRQSRAETRDRNAELLNYNIIAVRQTAFIVHYFILCQRGEQDRCAQGENPVLCLAFWQQWGGEVDVVPHVRVDCSV